LDGRAQLAESERAVEEEGSTREETDEMAGFKSSGFKSSGFKSSFKPAAPAHTELEDIDGEELGDDVDGAPLDDVDGAPLDDLDGEELEMDLDGESLEEVPVGTTGHPMGGDVDDIDGAPMPGSDEEAL
jgi:U2-associated protein SR140